MAHGMTNGDHPPPMWYTTHAMLVEASTLHYQQRQAYSHVPTVLRCVGSEDRTYGTWYNVAQQPVQPLPPTYVSMPVTDTRCGSAQEDNTTYSIVMKCSSNEG
jgi:hypothetical protein